MRSDWRRFRLAFAPQQRYWAGGEVPWHRGPGVRRWGSIDELADYPYLEREGVLAALEYATGSRSRARAGSGISSSVKLLLGANFSPREHSCRASREAEAHILARTPWRPSRGPGSHGRLVEHEYERMGALTYLDAWDVRRGGVIGRSEPKGGIEAFDRLVHQVMTKEPYASARRVFWVVDNGSDHRGQRSIDRLQGRWRNLVLVHLPVHASWLNQVEIYHSIIQRKVLDPNDFESTAELARTLNEFERRYNEIAEPFEWNFTRQKLAELMERLAAAEPQLCLAA